MGRIPYRPGLPHLDPLVQSLNPGQSLGTWKAGVTLYLSFYSSIPPSIHLPTRPSTQASIIHPSYSFIYPSFLPSPHLPIHHLSIHPSIFPSLHPPTHPSIIYPSIYPAPPPFIIHHPSFLPPATYASPASALFCIDVIPRQILPTWPENWPQAAPKIFSPAETIHSQLPHESLKKTTVWPDWSHVTVWWEWCCKH